MNSTVVVATLESDVAVTTAVPAVVSEVRVAVATPLAVSLVTVTLPRLPKLVSKSTSVSSATLLLN